MRHSGKNFGIGVRSLKQWRNAIMPEVREWSRSTGARIKPTPDGFSVNGNEFIRLIGKDSSSIESVLSINLTGCYLNEFNEMPQDFVEEIDFRVRIGDDRKIIYDWNPLGPKHWSEADYWDAADDISAVKIQFEMGDNPALSQDHIDGLIAKYPAGTYKHVRYILGLPCDQEGLVYQHVRWRKRPAGQPRMWYAGVDVGNTFPDHPTHAVLIGEWKGGAVAVAEHRWPTAHDSDLLTPERIADDMVEKFSRFGDVSVWAVDPAAVYMHNALKRRGQRVVLPDNDIKLGIEILDSYLTRGIFQIDRDKCPHLERDMLGYVWDSKSDGSIRERVPLKKDDHGPDAFRYAAVWRNEAMVPARGGTAIARAAERWLA